MSLLLLRALVSRAQTKLQASQIYTIQLGTNKYATFLWKLKKLAYIVYYHYCYTHFTNFYLDLILWVK